MLRLKTVSSPDISPDGATIAFVVDTPDVERDENVSHIWAVNWDGSGDRQLTSREGESESSPRFSPDGTWLAFLSSRGGDEDDGPTRLWLLPRAGGEAQPLEGLEGSVSEFDWSPDGRKLALVVKDPEPDARESADGEEIPSPIVIDRFAFKRDGEGYLDNRRERIWIYHLERRTAERLTDGDHDESSPAFSPDGAAVAFVSKRVDEPDRTVDSNIFVGELAAMGRAPRQLTTHLGEDSTPKWSPDGRTIAYLRGGDPAVSFPWYAITHLAAVPSVGGEERVLTGQHDRNIFEFAWSPDGGTILMVVEDNGSQILSSVPSGGGAVRTLIGGDIDIAELAVSPAGRVAVMSSTMERPREVHAVEGGKIRSLTEQNDALMAELDFGRTERYSATSADGTEVSGFVTYPADSSKGQRLPAILHLHGGPDSQHDYSYDMLKQVFAGAGYAVIAPNPRGSTGRGSEFSAALTAAWGSVDVQDVLASVDHAVAAGIADPDRLGVGGWSYGGMLTNYTIASDTRFKAAVSGASISNILSGYGTDHYVLAYEQEIGKPWENLEGWMRISYPFFRNQTIITPTLFMVGGSDVNVPTLASEQMYQALKSRGVDTRLVIYPDESHTISRPSFVKDHVERWVEWFDARLKPAGQ